MPHKRKAAEKVYSEVGKYSDLKNKKKNLKVIVAGCVAQAEGNAMLRRQPLIDSIIGPQMYQNLSKILLDETDKKNVLLDFREEKNFQNLEQKEASFYFFFFITIQKGVINFVVFVLCLLLEGLNILGLWKKL